MGGEIDGEWLKQSPPDGPFVIFSKVILEKNKKKTIAWDSRIIIPAPFWEPIDPENPKQILDAYGGITRKKIL